MSHLRGFPLPGASVDISARLQDCLDFAVQTVRAADRTDPLWDVDLGEVTGHDKLLLEASLFAFIVGRRGNHEGATSELLAAIRSRYDSARVLATLRRQPVQVATLGATLIVLWKRGLATEEEIDGLQTALSSPYVDSTERVPFRLLDRRWILSVAGQGHFIDHAALSSSAGCRSMHPIYMSREDAYAITHTVMYVTDFGAASPPDHLSAGLRGTLDDCLTWCLIAHDYDLVAELLLARVYLCRSLGAVGRVAWRDCISVWDQLGFLPSPTLHADAFLALTTESERVQYAHHHMYHTVLVAGLLCSAMEGLTGSLSPEEQSPEDESPEEEQSSARSDSDRARIVRVVRSVRDRLSEVFAVPEAVAVEVVQRIAPSPDTKRLDELGERWRRDGADPGLAARMAVEAAVIESARAHDLTALAGYLAQAVREDLLTPTVMVAADYLASQFTYAGLLADASPTSPATSAGVAASLSAPLASLADCGALRSVMEVGHGGQQSRHAHSQLS